MNTTMPKVSLVTISFNQHEFLKATIESVLSQTYSNIEYIVVDPGSKDGSRELIQQYADRLARVIFEPDEGAADGLNAGLRAATGDIFCYLNSDDILLPNAIQSAVDIFRRSPGVDVVYGHGVIIDAGGAVLRRCFSDRFNLVAAAYGVAVIVQPSTFFLMGPVRSVGGFNKNNRCAWDGELLVDLAQSGARFKRVNQFWSGYRVHASSITGSGRLYDQYLGYRAAMVKKVTGRTWGGLDSAIYQVLRVAKHLSSPSATWERLRKGPIFAANAPE